MNTSMRIAIALFVGTTAALLYSWHPAVGIGYVTYLLVVPRGAK